MLRDPTRLGVSGRVVILLVLALGLLVSSLVAACGDSPVDESTDGGGDEEDPEEIIPVIFVPGITGSMLASASPSAILWPPGGPGGDIDYSSLRDDFRRLSLNPQTGPHEDIYATDVIREYGSDPIYSPFLNVLTSEGGYIEYDVGGNPARRTTRGAFTRQEPKPSLFVFAYDWRQPIEENAHLLSEYVEVVAEFYPKKKVNIVTHSMGGLVARRYIIDHPGKVNKLITIAAPFLGSAKPLYQMIYGKLSAPANYGLEATEAGLAEFLTGGPVGDMVAYYPGLHELMSSEGYYSLGGPPYSIVESIIRTKELAFQELMGPNGKVDQLFPNPNGNDKSAAKTNRDFHSYSSNSNNQDDWSNDSTGVEYHHLIGVQSTNDTPLSIREALPGSGAFQVRDYALNLYGPGDGTVPRLSAERIGNGINYNAPKAKLYIYDGGPDSLLEHTGLMKNPEVIAKVLELLEEETLEIELSSKPAPPVFPVVGGGDTYCVRGARSETPSSPEIVTWGYRISSWTEAGAITGGAVTFVRCDPSVSLGYVIFRYNISSASVSLLNTDFIVVTAQKTTGGRSQNLTAWESLPDEQIFTITVDNWRKTNAKVQIGSTEYSAARGDLAIDPDLSE